MAFNLNVNGSSRPQMDFTIKAPTVVPRFNPPTTVSITITATPPNPRNEVSGSSSACIPNAWNAVIIFFKSCFGCFGLFSGESKLAKQMRYAKKQMNQEPVKSFRYAQAPTNWQQVTVSRYAREKRVGNLPVGLCHAQGRRPTMEDRHLTVQFNVRIGSTDYPVQFFGIFDGHGGAVVSRFLRDHLQQKIQQCLIEFNPNGLSNDGISRALRMACIRINRDLQTECGPMAQDQGSTATMAMILNGKLWTVNVGDSRTVLDNNGTPIQLTEDAHPEDPRYRRGIERRGGKVVDVGGVMRINGTHAVGRAFGDFDLNGAISARPKITMKPLSKIRPHSHLILCCDGIYDVARTKDIVKAVHSNRNLTASDLARNIVYSAWNSGSEDNLSALVVKIR